MHDITTFIDFIHKNIGTKTIGLGNFRVYSEIHLCKLFVIKEVVKRVTNI